jgi:hypothetical protein
MKKNIITYAIGLCFLSFLTILTPGQSEAAHAYEVSIQFTFDEQAPDIPEVSGYRLYKDGIAFCEESLTASQVMTCTVDAPGTFDFELAAVYINGRESPHSAPFRFSVTSEDVALVALQVLSGQNPQDIETLGSLAGTPVIDMADIIHSLKQSVQ